MPFTAHLGVRWRGERLWVEFLATLAEDADRLSTRDRSDTQRIPPGGTPGHEVFTWRGGFEVSEQLTLVLAVENLGDTSYRIHGSGLNEPGRNLVASARFRF
jgi:hemoglobin/transferrin/lactoferrin receptor protein